MKELYSMGIDPSMMHTGVAIVNREKQVVFATQINLPPNISGGVFVKIQKIISEIIEIREKYQPSVILIEDMFIGSKATAISLVQLGTLLRYFFWQEDILYADIAATTLKKFVTGKGNSAKEVMMMFTLKNWNYQSATNNIADAVGLAMLGLVGLGVPFPKAQLETVKRLNFKTLFTSAVNNI
jgi:crossover junction endodeoxyribonuclease RuvC